MSKEQLSARMERITKYDPLANAHEIARMTDEEFEAELEWAKRTFGK